MAGGGIRRRGGIARMGGIRGVAGGGGGIGLTQQAADRLVAPQLLAQRRQPAVLIETAVSVRRCLWLFRQRGSARPAANTVVAAGFTDSGENLW